MRKSPSNKKYTPEVKKFIEDNYPTRGAAWCAESLGDSFCEKGLNIFCSRNKIKKKRVYEGKESFDVEIFKNPTIPEMAYFLGLIWGDGHVDEGRVNLTLIEDDAIPIYEIIKKLGYFTVKRRIPSGGRKPVLLIRASNVKLARYLAEMDYRKKSLVSPSKILETIPKHLQRFFWLGFADADGCWYVGNSQSRFFISGSFNQDWTDFAEFVREINCCGDFRQTSRECGSNSELVIRKFGDIVLFGEILYQSYHEDNIGLLRKFAKFKEIKKLKENLGKSNKNGFRGVSAIVIKESTLYSWSFQRNSVIFRSNSSYKTAEAAAIDYDRKCVEILGHNASTNFPLKNYLPDLGMSYYFQSLNGERIYDEFSPAIGYLLGNTPG
jgi:hypothetical protein